MIKGEGASDNEVDQRGGEVSCAYMEVGVKDRRRWGEMVGGKEFACRAGLERRITRFQWKKFGEVATTSARYRRWQNEAGDA